MENHIKQQMSIKNLSNTNSFFLEFPTSNITFEGLVSIKYSPYEILEHSADRKLFHLCLCWSKLEKNNKVIITNKTIKPTKSFLKICINNLGDGWVGEICNFKLLFPPKFWNIV